MRIDKLKLANNIRFIACVSLFILGVVLCVKAILRANVAYILTGGMLILMAKIAAIQKR